jgi:hypothetical protein
MKKNSFIDDYLRRYSAEDIWKINAGGNNTDELFRVIVIPAYAEKEMLFSTLASIAKNQSSSLEHSFVLCVINNKSDSPSADKENNRQTIEYLDALVKKKSLKRISACGEICSLLDIISCSGLKLGFIDASSAGYEIPGNAGGVGMARKIGMDTALRLLNKKSHFPHLIMSLDADTLVGEDYLTETGNYFTPKVKTAIVAYEHQMSSDEREVAAMCCYEIFLRYWVLGLRYAKSPWAFHSIGSTIVTSIDAYVEVRGMNKREAGEDFYFLSKLAKAGNIGYIKTTCVYPSSRSSVRVPFGTAKRIQRFLTGRQKEEYLLYDPAIFLILAEWLQLMNCQVVHDKDEILMKAGEIHPGLKKFLLENNFPAVWPKICSNAKDGKTLLKQFNDWFDALKTLKLVNYFTREIYPQINMFAALKIILYNLGLSGLKIESEGNIPILEEQIEILRYLRSIT